MNISMNAEWASFQRRGIAKLGRGGFAEWLQHAADVVRAEAKREAIDAAYAPHRCAHGVFCPHHKEAVCAPRKPARGDSANSARGEIHGSETRATDDPGAITVVVT